MARLTEAIKLSECDVISNARSDKWSIRAPRASLGTAMGKRVKAVTGRVVFLLGLGEVECSGSVGSGLHRLPLFVDAWVVKDNQVTCREQTLVEREGQWLRTCVVMLKELPVVGGRMLFYLTAIYYSLGLN